MFSHIFKLIWKKKSSNFLLTLEIFFSYIVLFAVFSFSVYLFRTYKGKSGIDVENVWVANLEFNSDTAATIELVRQKLKTFPEIESFSFSTTNVPYSFSTMQGTLRREGREAPHDYIEVEPDYPKAMGMTLSAGRWFAAEDTIGGKYRPIVVTKALAEALFGEEDAVGKGWKSSDDSKDRGQIIVGIVDHFKHKSDFQESGSCSFEPFKPHRSRNAVMLKMRPGADAELEGRITKGLLQLGSGWNVEIQHLDQMKSTQNMFFWIPMLVALSVCGFLVINVALGLFGVLFQNINRRRGEIGVRRAMGATKKEILLQFVGETAMLVTLSVTLGIFLAAQFPLLNVFDVKAGIYWTGILLAVVAIYGIILLCAWYPSRQASQIYPAEALREE